MHLKFLTSILRSQYDRTSFSLPHIFRYKHFTGSFLHVNTSLLTIVYQVKMSVSQPFNAPCVKVHLHHSIQRVLQGFLNINLSLIAYFTQLCFRKRINNYLNFSNGKSELQRKYLKFQRFLISLSITIQAANLLLSSNVSTNAYPLVSWSEQQILYSVQSISLFHLLDHL